MTNQLTLFACREGGFYAQDVAGKSLGHQKGFIHLSKQKSAG